MKPSAKQFLVIAFIGVMLWIGFHTAKVAWDKIQDRKETQNILQENP